MNKAILKHAAERHPTAILQPYDVLMERVGFDALCAICETIGSATVYVPTIRSMLLGCLSSEAVREYNGYNSDALAKKYGFSNRHMRRILAGV